MKVIKRGGKQDGFGIKASTCKEKREVTEEITAPFSSVKDNRKRTDIRK